VIETPPLVSCEAHATNTRESCSLPDLVVVEKIRVTLVSSGGIIFDVIPVVRTSLDESIPGVNPVKTQLFIPEKHNMFKADNLNMLKNKLLVDVNTS
jgi:hypothetical protein